MLYIERLTACDDLRETLQRYLNYNYNSGLGGPSSNFSPETGSANMLRPLAAVIPPPLPSSTSTVQSAVETRPENLNKVRERAESYQIKIRHFPRPYKNLVVLDIDYTILDLGLYEKGVAEKVDEETLATSVRRPFLHQFLAQIYKDYDIGIWSATNMEVLEKKMKLLGVDNANNSYKISFYLDRLAMICVDSPRFGRVRRVKPLGLVWSHFPQFSPQNTIMIDDSEKSFIMNPQSGLKIRKFVQAREGAADKVLLHLSEYLRTIGSLRDFSCLDHSKWEIAARPSLKQIQINEESDDPSALSDLE